MLPPVLEIFVIWHPDDAGGRHAARRFVQHFHGRTFSGLIGGAIEIYARSDGWLSSAGAPRPIPLPGEPPPNGVTQAELTVIVPVLGLAMAEVVEGGGAWFDYLSHILDAQTAAPDRVRIFPLQIDAQASEGTQLGQMFHHLQRIAAPAHGTPAEDEAGLGCRDLAQGITQWASPSPGRLKVFISHTRRTAPDTEEDVIALVNQVRGIISDTRLAEFFDAHDLQPGEDWEAALREHAASGVLLALRTDLYASREWCQLEMSIAKQQGLPIVILDSLDRGEERGSYLLDHVPRIPVRRLNDEWSREGVLRCLNLLVDESLKRVLWHRQEALAQGVPGLDVAWWAPRAPELMTLTAWIEENRNGNHMPSSGNPLRILHPDPPLGPEELRILKQLVAVAGIPNDLDILTPRLLAVRGF